MSNRITRADLDDLVESVRNASDIYNGIAVQSRPGGYAVTCAIPGTTGRRDLYATSPAVVIAAYLLGILRALDAIRTGEPR